MQVGECSRMERRTDKAGAGMLCNKERSGLKGGVVGWWHCGGGALVIQCSAVEELRWWHYGGAVPLSGIEK